MSTLIQQYMKEMGQYPILSEKEEKEILYLIKNKNDNQAKEKLINSNLRLVISIATKYHTNKTYELLDLIQEGNIGLIKAIEKFDPKKGYKFSTYATYWIKQSISRAIADNSRTIRLPVYMYENLTKIQKAQNKLTLELGRKPTYSEISSIVGIPVKDIEETLSYSKDIISSDIVVSEDEETTIASFVPDSNETPEERSSRIATNKCILELLDSSLNERESFIIKERYGLIDNNPKTLEEIGSSLGLSKERVRQLQNQALTKLKSPIRLKKFKEIL